MIGLAFVLALVGTVLAPKPTLLMCLVLVLGVDWTGRLKREVGRFDRI